MRGKEFALICKLLSDGEIPILGISMWLLDILKGTQVYWLKQMMERRLISDQDCRLIKSTCSISALQIVNQWTVILRYTEFHMKLIFPS